MTIMNFTNKASYMLISLFFCFSIQGSEQATLTFAQAQSESKDATNIDDLMLKEGINDCDKIVILPNKFRKKCIESAIDEGRFFVAYQDDLLVGYKKLFLLSDEQERIDTLTGEIRCINGTLIDKYLYSKTEEYARQSLLESSLTEYDDCVCIYDGGDFTKNSCRKRGINKGLTNAAFSLLKEDTRNLVASIEAKRIVLVYGLTHLNDYNDLGEGQSRTPSIVSAFIAFISQLTGQTPEEVRHYRYKAFMPTFPLETDAAVPTPNPDSESVPGYGNVLEVRLPMITKEQS